jgi:GntR family transcriptional regulator/MocR family aminotransferase
VLCQGIPTLPQLVLAEFMQEGRFAAHIRRMRVAYFERQRTLLSALKEQAAGLLEAEPTDAGMHLIAWLPDGADDMAVAGSLWQGGIDAIPLSIYTTHPYPRAGLLLGFTAVPPETIGPKVEQMVQILKQGRS